MRGHIHLTDGLYAPASAGESVTRRSVGEASPPRPTTMQAKAESAINPVGGTNASSTPPTARPNGVPPVSSVERAPKTRPSCALGMFRCSAVVSIGVLGPHITLPSHPDPH